LKAGRVAGLTVCPAPLPLSPPPPCHQAQRSPNPPHPPSPNARRRGDCGSSEVLRCRSPARCSRRLGIRQHLAQLGSVQLGEVADAFEPGGHRPLRARTGGAGERGGGGGGWGSGGVCSEVGVADPSEPRQTPQSQGGTSSSCAAPQCPCSLAALYCIACRTTNEEGRWLSRS